MTTNDVNNYDKVRICAIENSNAVNKMLEEDVPRLKEKSISSELNKFWDDFQGKVNKVKRAKKDNQVLNVYVVLSENRTVVINEMDVIEPWFVKITGIDCEIGNFAPEIINSRTNEPEIIVELVDL